MKYIFLLIGLVLAYVFISCSKKNEDENNPASLILKINKVLLLKVNYATYNFEGGKELAVSPEKSKVDSLPIGSDYGLSGYVGSIFLYYQSKTDSVLFGTVRWVGEGEIYFPKKFNSIDYFSLLDTEISTPPQSRFQLISSTYVYKSQTSIDYLSIWKAVSKLKIVDEYLLSNKKIGLFIYTPHVAVVDSAQWSYILILAN